MAVGDTWFGVKECYKHGVKLILKYLRTVRYLSLHFNIIFFILCSFTLLLTHFSVIFVAITVVLNLFVSKPPLV